MRPTCCSGTRAAANAIELKAEGGRTSDAQVEMLTRLKDAGVLTAVCHGLDPALATLEGWQLLRGSVQ